MNNQPADQITSQSLLVRVRNCEDKEAWRTFVDVYTPVIFSYCRHRKLQESDAADVSQEVLLTLSKSLASFEYQPERGRFRDWLGRVTYRELLHFWKRKKRDDTAPLLDDSEAMDDSTGWEQHFHTQLLQQAMERIRNEFSIEAWEIFEKVWIQDQPANEVAQSFGITIGNLYMTKSRVLKRLRAEVLMLSDDLPLLNAGSRSVPHEPSCLERHDQESSVRSNSKSTQSYDEC